ncbi:MAG: CAP domain-containing protein [Anaerolineae bacterium]|nr:CAP domain-containing protein [Anaerolineae bacterium]
MPRRLTMLLSALLLAGNALTLAPVVSAQTAASITDELIAELNAWRLEEAGLWPLKPNPLLTTLAVRQAQYVLSLPEIPDDIHTGPDGSAPPERARAAGWPVYGRPEQIAIGEIAQVGPDVEDAIAYWQSSDIHHRTVMNSAYREVGVAVLPHKYGHVFLVVFGARPNVLTAFANPLTQQLYLSDERFPGAARSTEWLFRASEVRLFDEDGRPLGGWMPWRPVLPLPDAGGNHLFVAYRNATQETLAAVHLNSDLALLPAAVAAAPPSPTAAAPVSTQPSASPAAPAAPVVSSPTPRPPAASVPIATPTPNSVTDVLLVYDGRSLSLVNVSGKPLDLTPLVIAGEAQSLALTRWQTPWLSGSLAAFPSGDCVQAWAWTEASEPAQPGVCRFRRSVINLAPEARFWTTGAFALRLGDAVLTTCPGGMGTCAADLP